MALCEIKFIDGLEAVRVFRVFWECTVSEYTAGKLMPVEVVEGINDALPR